MAPEVAVCETNKDNPYDTKVSYPHSICSSTICFSLSLFVPLSLSLCLSLSLSLSVSLFLSFSLSLPLFPFVLYRLISGVLVLL